MLLFNELPIVFPWYDKLEKQARYRENVDNACDYKLITPANAMLPFQFRRPSGIPVIPILWEIKRLSDNVTIRDISDSLPLPTGTDELLRMKQRGEYDYFYYNGAALVSEGINIVPLDIGFYYSKITMNDGSTFYSEEFHVPQPSLLHNSDAEIDNTLLNYLRFDFYNTCDISPILYNDLTDDLPFFKQIFYLDSIVTSSEPELAVDGAKDGNDVVIPSFQRLAIKHRITALVSDYMKIAISLLPLHSSVRLTTEKGHRSGDIDRLAITSAVEANGALSTVDILFEQELAVVKSGCCENLEEPGDCPEADPPTIESITGVNPLTITGTATPFGWVELYESTDGVTWKFVKVITSTMLGAGHVFDRTNDLYTFFRIISRSITCDFGTSETFEI